MDRPDVEHWRGREVARLLTLVETERRYYQEIVASLPLGLAVVTANAEFKSANRAFRQMFSLRPDDLPRRTLDQVITSADLHSAIRMLSERELAQHPPVVFESGTRRLRASLIPVRDWEDDADLDVLLAVEPAPAAIAAAAAGRVTSAQSQVSAAPPSPAPVTVRPVAPAPPPAPAIAPEELPALIWAGEADAKHFNAILGDSSQIPHPGLSSTRIHAGDRDRLLAFYGKALDTPGTHACEYRGYKADERVAWYRDCFTVSAGAGGRAEKVAGVVTEISTRFHAEQMGIQAQRLDAIAALSRTLTHELNNSLMVITGYSEELLTTFPPADARNGEVREIISAAERISTISGQLLPFTRKQAFPREPVRVAECIARAIGDDNLETNVPARLSAMADQTQLEEAIRSVIGKAREHGSVSISARALRLNEQVPDCLPPGNYVEISFWAPGAPMISFENLVPAKDAVGPELARAQAWILEWGGGVWQAPGEVHLVLPAAQVEEEEPQGPAPAATSGRVPEIPVAAETLEVVIEEPAPETILVVEDESGIRALMRKILRRQNYDVLEAGSPEEAVEVAARHGERINLLITDMTLPKRNGRQLADDLRRTLPNLKVLYVSGYTDDTAVYEGDLPAGADFLQKPFTLGSLLKKVREVLDRQP